jgi:hypothetical protein
MQTNEKQTGKTYAGFITSSKLTSGSSISGIVDGYIIVVSGVPGSSARMGFPNAQTPVILPESG